jgi:uncharacterized protein YdeI (YjbR/CyaY-like superfamily)
MCRRIQVVSAALYAIGSRRNRAAGFAAISGRISDAEPNGILSTRAVVVRAARINGNGQTVCAASARRRTRLGMRMKRIDDSEKTMKNTDARIDAYIEKSEDFAKPILKHLRELVHAACPEIVETMKWSFPHFDYKGIVCSMAAFKQHCAFGFWKASLMQDAHKILTGSDEAMGQMGRIESLKDLPADKILISYIKEAVQLNERGIKLPAKSKAAENEPLNVPDYFTATLKENKKAFDAFENFSRSHRKEYVEWITEAKTEATRNRRMATAIEWLAEGKSRNWKYERK